MAQQQCSTRLLEYRRIRFCVTVTPCFGVLTPTTRIFGGRTAFIVLPLMERSHWPFPQRCWGTQEQNRSYSEMVQNSRLMPSSLQLVMVHHGLISSRVCTPCRFRQSSPLTFSAKTAEELGLGRHPPLTDDKEHVWAYTSLRDPPSSHPLSGQWASSIYRGIVPAKNIGRRDFAINGAVVRTSHLVS